MPWRQSWSESSRPPPAWVGRRPPFTGTPSQGSSPAPHWGHAAPRGPHATTRVLDRSAGDARRLHVAVPGRLPLRDLTPGPVLRGLVLPRHFAADQYGRHGRPGTGDGRRHRRRLAVRAAPSRDHRQGRLHVGDGPGGQPADVPLPRVRRQVPRGLQPRAAERIPGPGDHPQARGGRRHQHHQGHRVLRRQAAGRPQLRLRGLQPPPRPSLHAGEGHGDPPATGTGAVRRLHVPFPRGGADVRDAPPLLRRRAQPGAVQARPGGLHRDAVRHLGERAHHHRSTPEGQQLGRAQRVL